MTSTEESTTINSSVDLSPTSAKKTDGDQKDTVEVKNASSKTYTNEDLIELVRAVKFSNPDASIRAVHNEITTKMALAESFEFLKIVKLNDVKKVWKKALVGHSPPAVDATKHDDAVKSKKTNRAATSNNCNEKSSSVDPGAILKFYTVGDGSVQMLAKKYTLHEAALVAATKTEEREQELQKYVHCFLDVPADRSGNRPHQALINFNENNRAGKVYGRKQKRVFDDDDGREIVKIQVAAPLPGIDVKTPMLLYNSDRSATTFIHPDNDDETGGYNRIWELINSHGIRGALSSGGTKAYFFARNTTRQEAQSIISVDVVSGLAPMQEW